MQEEVRTELSYWSNAMWCGWESLAAAGTPHLLIPDCLEIWNALSHMHWRKTGLSKNKFADMLGSMIGRIMIRSDHSSLHTVLSLHWLPCFAVALYTHDIKGLESLPLESLNPPQTRSQQTESQYLYERQEAENTPKALLSKDMSRIENRSADGRQNISHNRWGIS